MHVGNLTRNVNKDHLREIFGHFGTIKRVTLDEERLRPWINKGYAYVEFESPDDVDSAIKHMNGGQVRNDRLLDFET